MPQPSRPVVKQLLDRAVDAYNLRYGVNHPYFSDADYVPLLITANNIKYTAITVADANPPVGNNLMWMNMLVCFTYCSGVYDSVLKPITRYGALYSSINILVGRRHMLDVQRELALPAIV